MMASATVMAITKYNAISRANINLLFFFNFSIASRFSYRQIYMDTRLPSGIKIVMIGVAFVICAPCAMDHIKKTSSETHFPPLA
jgi:hypothetical protein